MLNTRIDPRNVDFTLKVIDPYVVDLWQRAIAGVVSWPACSVGLSTYLADPPPRITKAERKDLATLAAVAWEIAFH